jgi:type III secretion protein T
MRQPELAWAAQVLFAYTLGLPRLLAVFTLLPFTSRGVITGLARTGVVASLGLFAYPMVAPTVGGIDLPPVLLFLLILKEVAIGSLLGFSVAILFWGVESAGFIIDNQRGAAIASSINPLSGTDTTPLGILFMQAYTIYFIATGGFLAFLGLVYETYALWPVLSFWPVLPPEAVGYFLGLADKVMFIAVLYAGPIMAAMFLAEFGLALVSRFAPQLNVFILAMPVKSGVAMFVLVLYIPFLFSYLNDTFAEIGLAFAALRRMLAP